MINIKLSDFNKDEVFALIKKNINGCIIGKGEEFNNRYNCNVAIEDVSSVLRYGLLSTKKKVMLCEGRKLTDEEYIYYTSDSHVNGVDYISVSRMDLDFSKMYRNEDWYDASAGVMANLVISNEVKACLVTHHFYNEFLVFDQVEPRYFEAVDVRLLRVFESCMAISEKFMMENLLKQYNCLRDIAVTMIDEGLDIPLREASAWSSREIREGQYMVDIIEDKSGIVTLDTNKVANLPKIMIKK